MIPATLSQETQDKLDAETENGNELPSNDDSSDTGSDTMDSGDDATVDTPPMS